MSAHPKPSGKYVGGLRAATALGMAAALVAALFCEKPEAWGQTRRPEEVKAAFLFNFTRFVEWPAKAFETSESPFIIAVTGDEDVVAQLQSMVRNEKVRNRPVQIRSCRRPREAEGCHMLYIGGNERVRVNEFLEVVRGRAVLTIGDTGEFLREGGVVQFVTERTIRLRINLRNARQAGLTISSQLLRLAELENQ